MSLLRLQEHLHLLWVTALRDTGWEPVLCPQPTGQRSRRRQALVRTQEHWVLPKEEAESFNAALAGSLDSPSTNVSQLGPASTPLPEYLSQMVAHPYQEPQAFAQPTQVHTRWLGFFAPLPCILPPFAGVDRVKGVSSHASLARGPRHSIPCRPLFEKPCRIGSSHR